MEDGIIKPLIICGGCSFTHSPDSWAQVLGNNRKDEDCWANDFFKVWRGYGIEQCGVNPDVFPDHVYDYWDEGEYLTDYIDVLIVGQGAAGNDLNSRVIRNVIQAEREKYPDRPIGVFWQLSGWDRIEFLTNVWEIPWHKELYDKDEHMTSVIKPWVRTPSDLKQVGGHSPWNSPTPEAFLPKNRYWWKSGGAGHEQWVDSPLEEFTKEYYENIWTNEHTAVKNLEYIEHTRLFCDNLDIPITIFPGWSHTWDKALNLGAVQSSMSAFELLGRLPDDIVTDIPGYHGIAEWAMQYELFSGPGFEREYDQVKPYVQKLSYLGSSSYEKYKDMETGEYIPGNHPSCYAHAMFSHHWINPRVKEMLKKFN
tara:strand:+ start:441 stop:1541 length:1101 start_codon:yes stop_codon:yes gene_type:complete